MKLFQSGLLLSIQLYCHPPSTRRVTRSFTQGLLIQSDNRRFVNSLPYHNPQTDEHESINSVANGGIFYCQRLGDDDINANPPSRLRSRTNTGSLYPISSPYLSCGRLTTHTAHFLRTTYTAAFTVSVRSVKVGSSFTNLTADLIQDVCDHKHP